MKHKEHSDPSWHPGGKRYDCVTTFSGDGPRNPFSTHRAAGCTNASVAVMERMARMPTLGLGEAVCIQQGHLKQNPVPGARRAETLASRSGIRRA